METIIVTVAITIITIIIQDIKPGVNIKDNLRLIANFKIILQSLIRISLNNNIVMQKGC